MKTLLSVAVLAAMTNPTWAAPIGTPAGDTISNTASIVYDVGGTTQTAIESSEGGNSVPGSGSPTTFIVDEKVDLLVTPDSGVTVSAPGTTVAITFTLTNEGNGTRDFSFASLAAIAAGDDFDPTTCSTPANEVAVISGDTRTITINCAIPATGVGGVINGATANVDLKATAVGALADAAADAGTDNQNIEETVLADGSGTTTDGAPRNADHSAINTYTVSTANLTVTKTEAITTMSFDADDNAGTGTNGNEVDVTGGETLFHIPGATVEYVVSVANGAGAANATNLTITDTFPIGTLNFVSCAASGSGITGCSLSGGNVISDAPAFSLLAGQTATMTITATVK